jgi:hypothetical protein
VAVSLNFNKEMDWVLLEGKHYGAVNGIEESIW